MWCVDRWHGLTRAALSVLVSLCLSLSLLLGALAAPKRADAILPALVPAGAAAAGFTSADCIAAFCALVTAATGVSLYSVWSTRHDDGDTDLSWDEWAVDAFNEYLIDNGITTVVDGEEPPQGGEDPDPNTDAFTAILLLLLSGGTVAISQTAQLVGSFLDFLDGEGVYQKESGFVVADPNGVLSYPTVAIEPLNGNSSRPGVCIGVFTNGASVNSDVYLFVNRSDVKFAFINGDCYLLYPSKSKTEFFGFRDPGGSNSKSMFSATFKLNKSIKIDGNTWYYGDGTNNTAINNMSWAEGLKYSCVSLSSSIDFIGSYTSTYVQPGVKPEYQAANTPEKILEFTREYAAAEDDESKSDAKQKAAVVLDNQFGYVVDEAVETSTDTDTKTNTDVVKDSTDYTGVTQYADAPWSPITSIKINRLFPFCLVDDTAMIVDKLTDASSSGSDGAFKVTLPLSKFNYSKIGKPLADLEIDFSSIKDAAPYLRDVILLLWIAILVSWGINLFVARGGGGD